MGLYQPVASERRRERTGLNQIPCNNRGTHPFRDLFYLTLRDAFNFPGEQRMKGNSSWCSIKITYPTIRMAVGQLCEGIL